MAIMTSWVAAIISTTTI